MNLPRLWESFQRPQSTPAHPPDERPEKCPIQTFEYNTRGFARKYDKDRHIPIHYKDTMICGFCPDSGNSDERIFNRAHVFKGHLLSEHHVEQTPTNSRKKTPTCFSTSKSTELTGCAPDANGQVQHLFSAVLQCSRLLREF